MGYFGRISILRIICGIWLVSLGVFLILIWIAVKISAALAVLLILYGFIIGAVDRIRNYRNHD